MEWEIGEIFEYNGEWYQCVGHPYNECTDCDFCFETNKEELIYAIYFIRRRIQ